MTAWQTVATERGGLAAVTGGLPVNSWLLGPPVAFVLSFLIFGQEAAVAPDPPAPAEKTARAVPVTATMNTNETTWASGEHASDTAIEDYVWAASPLVSSSQSQTAAQVRISCGSDWEFVSVEFTEAPVLENVTPIGGGYYRFSAGIAWDGKTETVEFLQEQESSTISFADGPDVISRLAAASTMVLILSWRGQDPALFEFPLKGSSAAIESMWSSCRQQDSFERVSSR